MELDTGSPVSIISESTHKFINSPPLYPSPLTLKTYTGEAMDIKSMAHVKVRQLQGTCVYFACVCGFWSWSQSNGRDWLSQLNTN